MSVTPKDSGHKDSCQLSAISYQLLDERPNSKDTKTAISGQLSAFSFRMKDANIKDSDHKDSYQLSAKNNS
jgi:hypothetical protein